MGTSHHIKHTTYVQEKDKKRKLTSKREIFSNNLKKKLLA